MQRFFGIGLFLLPLLLGACSAASAGGHVRTYYIAADEVLWDYAPMRRNQMMGMPYDGIERAYTMHTPHRIRHPVL